MRRRRIAVALAASAALVVGVISPAHGAASRIVHPFVSTNACGPSPVPPCVVKLTRDGANEIGNPSYVVSPSSVDSGDGMFFDLELSPGEESHN